MSEQEPPKIEFPCENYPIKVLGVATDAYRDEVVDIIEVHAPGIDRSKVSVRDSRNGRFHSITVFITATGVPQLESIFESLKKHSGTRMVL